jgi:hypothetical protein
VGDRCALDPDAITLDGLGGLDGNLIARGVALLDSQVVVFQIDLQIGEDEFLFDLGPDDPGHFIAVHLDNGILDFDLFHDCSAPPPLRFRFGPARGV